MKIASEKQTTLIDTKVLETQQQQALQKVIHVVRDKGLMLGFAESCTGGLLSSLMTAEAGVSEFFWGSVISYSNESKNLLLNVENAVFQRFGAVSANCASQMSEGLVKQIAKTFAEKKAEGKTVVKDIVTVSVTGIAGPDGGSDMKPVGTVFISVSGTKIATQVFHHEFVGQNNKQLARVDIQKAAAVTALEHLLQAL